MIAIHCGSHSSFKAWSDVNTVLPSIGMPGGTNGTEPVAMMMFFAVTVPPTSTRPGSEYLTVWLSTNLAWPMRMSTPSASSERLRLPWIVLARLVAWSAMPWRSNETAPTWMPIALRCISFFMSRTRPDAASSALDGTQPRLTHVPPMSWPSTTATFMPCSTACSAAPWPPTPQPMMTRS
jgi:hypothetical protein